MTLETGELTAIGTLTSAALGLAWKGLNAILKAMREQQTSQQARDDRMIETLSSMQKDAHRVIERNTVAIERGAKATGDLTIAVERLTGRVELVERVVAKGDTGKFQRSA